MTQVPAGVEVRQHQVDTRGSPSDNHVMKREESMEPHCWQDSSRKTTLFRASAHAGESVGSAAELESEAEACTVQYISAERPSIQKLASKNGADAKVRQKRRARTFMWSLQWRKDSVRSPKSVCAELERLRKPRSRRKRLPPPPLPS